MDLLLEHLCNGYNLLSLGKEYLGCQWIGISMFCKDTPFSYGYPKDATQLSCH